MSWLYDWMLDRTWADWWGMVQGLALCATAGVAWYQLGALRDEQELVAGMKRLGEPFRRASDLRATL